MGKSANELQASDDSKPEEEYLLHYHSKRKQPIWRNWRTAHLIAVHALNFALMLALFVLLSAQPHDISLGVYSPANEAVEYVEHHFTAALFNKTDYMGYPTDETDRLWEELYNFGVSAIPWQQAQKLHTPTVRIPDRKDYVIELDVWHQLHCLNDLRKVLYEDRYGKMAMVTENGHVNFEHIEFRHWDHCIDALRQSIMCHADVSPISWRVNIPIGKIVAPRLATTHTCRNFLQIQHWAKAHQAGDIRVEITPEESRQIVEDADFDMNPEEDIEFLWPSFPGNMFFKHWRDHPLADMR